MLMQLLAEFWNILQQSAVFILLGFLFAAGLHVVMSRTRWADWLQSLSTKSVLLAAAIAAPLPLCSCSVIPAAVSLRKRGASKGAVLSFLISAPETNVESITFTWGLLGPVFAIFRPIAGLITAFTAGIVENFFERRFPTGEPAAIEGADAGAACCGTAPAPATTDAACCGGHGAPGAAADHAGCGAGDALAVAEQRATWRDGMRHAFVDVFDGVVGWMLFGVAVAAVINVLVPGYVINAVFGPPLQAMLVMLAIGIPLYVCAEASTPIAAALILQGVNPGAALVFLLAGPATNIGSLFVLSRHLGRRTMVIYLTTIAIVAVAMAFVLNWLFVISGVKVEEHVLSTPLVPGVLKTGGAVLFLVLAVVSAVRLRADRRLASWLDAWSPVRVTPPRMTWTLVVAALAAYVLSGFVIVEPGQVGMIKRFGRVVQAEVGPGLHWAGPYPVGSVDRIDTRKVYRLELGAASAALNAQDLPEDDRAWVLLGDENFANIKCAAHWHMAPGQARAFAYGAEDREKLVACAVRAALRQVLGQASIDTVFTTDQAQVADAVHRQAQTILDSHGCGIALVSFDFLDLHAPPQVHESFRDVASALEDSVTRRNQALARQAEIAPLARGTRDKLVGAARADAVRVSAEAEGEADAFLATVAAYREYPELTRTRALFEMYDRILPGRTKFIRPVSPGLQLDLRFGGEKRDAGAP